MYTVPVCSYRVLYRRHAVNVVKIRIHARIIIIMTEDDKNSEDMHVLYKRQV